jgi:cyclomaltodextrinase / maltogenic alpha-amylase / neopullulanase
MQALQLRCGFFTMQNELLSLDAGCGPSPTCNNLHGPGPRRYGRLWLLLPWLLMIPPNVQSQQQSFVPEWAADAVFYQIFPERFANGDPGNDPPDTQPWGKPPSAHNFFGGDLRGITRNLDYIAALGVNAIYLNPIFDSPSNHKYDTRDYLKLDPHFGEEADLRMLLDECHARGMRVIIDGVFNHTGVEFFAFRDVKVKGPLSPYKDWYFFRDFPVGPPGNPNYECWWNLGSLPKLNTDIGGVRAYLHQVTRKWMEMGIDGWRLDVPNEIPHEFWVEWRTLVKSIRPDAYITGEIWDDALEWLKGDQFDAVMNYRFRNACVDFFAKHTMLPSEFDRTLAAMRSSYSVEAQYALQNLLGSHDTERFRTLCDGDLRRVKLAVLFQMTYIGAPMIYYGDEVGMEGGKDPGCRKTMVWKEERQDRDLLKWYRTVIQLRLSNAVFRRGDYSPLVVDDSRNLLVFVRRYGPECAIVGFNNGSATQSITLDLNEIAPGAVWRTMIPEQGVLVADPERNVEMSIPPLTAVIFKGGRRQ